LAFDHRFQRRLYTAVSINFCMFGVELTAALTSGSVSMQADALEFLGDAGNFLISVVVADMITRRRACAAILKAAIMGLFGLWIAARMAEHVLSADPPNALVMGVNSIAAFAANLTVAVLVFAYRGSDGQMLSVWLCTRNDCLANLAVLLASVAVAAFGTPLPDLAVAGMIAGLGLSAAWQVVRQALLEPRLTDAPAAAD
jgi:Co/Zn/Cd efflux system component